MAVVHNTRSCGVVGGGSFPGRDDKPGLAHTSERVNTDLRREERGPSMFHGKRNGGSVCSGKYEPISHNWFNPIFSIEKINEKIREKINEKIH